VSHHIRQALTGRGGEAGFTLIELMISILIALLIMAGLFASFSQQNTEYSYQNRRVDAVQDLEFAIKFIADDIRASLVIQGASSVEITDDASGRTVLLEGRVWSDNLDDWGSSSHSVTAKTAQAQAQSYRAKIQYTYDPVGQSLSYDRNILDIGGANPTEILPNVTYFKVFEDGLTSRDVPAGNPNAGKPYPGIPAALPPIDLQDSAAAIVPDIPGYTILVEIAVQAGYDQGQMQDVLGNPTTNKRVWRYVQVHPQAATN